MEKRGERQGGGSDDGNLDLMADVVEQQVRDAYDTSVPGRCAEAPYYIFNDESESENYVFGFKSALNYMKFCPVGARPVIYYRHGYEGGFIAKGRNSARSEKANFYIFLPGFL